MIDDVHEHHATVEIDSADAYVTAAATSALDDVTLFGGEPRGDDVIDLARNATECLRQLISLNLRVPVLFKHLQNHPGYIIA